ncbi:IS3 family transposase [Alkanindiges sp. WGS2144]|uniref:IS3 family transposase n=1 Tax=Alkanindiges sp. WGS2144 TaxID=3366808 RepID=UPI003751933F
MAKYSQEFKLKVVQYFISTNSGRRTVSKHFEISDEHVRKWVDIYQLYGEEGLKTNNSKSKYSFALKQQTVLFIIEEGLSIREAMKASGLKSSALVASWLRQYKEYGIAGLKPKQRGSPKTMSKPLPAKADGDKTQAELLEELAYLRAENAYLKKRRALRLEREAKQRKARLISELRQIHALKHLLRAAKLARSTYFYHQQSFKMDDKYSELKQQIKAIYHQHKGRYGYRRITLTLKNLGNVINHKCVQRLMQSMGLKSRIRIVKYRSYKGEVGKVADNVLQRQFKADRPNYKWVTDVTEFNVRGEKLYLSPIMDLFNGEIIAFKTQRRPVYSLVKNMMDDALKQLKPNEKPIVHSDQGWQYQMRHYQYQLAQHGLTISMSRKGNCLDNAAMESFFGILKSECFHGYEFASIDELEQTVKAYIHYYNHERIKVKLKGLSPVEYRKQASLTA